MRQRFEISRFHPTIINRNFFFWNALLNQFWRIPILHILINLRLRFHHQKYYSCFVSLLKQTRRWLQWDSQNPYNSKLSNFFWIIAILTLLDLNKRVTFYFVWLIGLVINLLKSLNIKGTPWCKCPRPCRYFNNKTKTWKRRTISRDKEEKTRKQRCRFRYI